MNKHLHSLVVTHLHRLFEDLAQATSPAVLPEVELAKLALMTSKDEEAEAVARAPTETSSGTADTDSTLVDTTVEGPTSTAPDTTQVAAESSPKSPTSVLGKRPGEALEDTRESRRSPMEVDERSSPTRKLASSLDKDDSQPEVLVDKDEDAVMLDSTSKAAPMQPPPLPPRKRTETVGDMMFGMYILRGHQSYTLLAMPPQESKMMWPSAWITASSKSKLPWSLMRSMLKARRTDQEI
jgi:ubiquitin carboxyl-terminal hydrolase 25